MTRIAIANPKGGVGKSSLSTHVAGDLASRGYSVMLRDTQNYVHLAANGLTVFDVQTSRMEQDREQWKSIGKWLEA